MTILYGLLIACLSSFLWRVRGGMTFWGKKAPVNKIWYALAFGLYGCFYFSFGWENFIVGALAAYASYQAFGWGLYISRLLTGEPLNPNLIQYRECELIDDILYSAHITLKGKKFYLYQYPKWFGFIGTTLIGLIVTFLWGLYLGNLVIMACGLGMGICYYLGYLVEKIKPIGKYGWDWGEWIFGFYLGCFLTGGIL